MMPGAGDAGRKKETMGDENTTAERCRDCGLSFAAVPARLHFAPACVRRLKEQKAALVDRLAEEMHRYLATRADLDMMKEAYAAACEREVKAALERDEARAQCDQFQRQAVEALEKSAVLQDRLTLALVEVDTAHARQACVRRLKEQREALVNRLAEECMEHGKTRKKLTLALVEVDTAHARQAEAERRLAALAGAKV